MFNEHAIRKPTWREGTPVVLADGQAWHVPQPWLRLKPTVEHGSVRLIGGLTFGPEHDAEFEKLFVEADAFERLQLEATIVVRLLQSQYDLPDEAFAELIPFDSRDEANREMWAELQRVIRGDTPKPSPVGSE